MTHDDLVILTAWMAENDYTAADIADAVEKPQKWEDELAEAKRSLAGTEEGGAIWDDPESPAAKAAIAELRAMREALAAQRRAGYPSGSGGGSTDTTRHPALYLVK